jgi:ABC-type multidrug transport system ATPase subunit
MKTCSVCHTENAEGDKFCRQCGRPLDLPPEDKTRVWTGGALPVAGKGPTHLTFVVTALFAGKDRIVIGRAPDCDIALAHPMVSRYHALLEHRTDGLRIRDLASVNGVSVAGVRITEPTPLREGEPVGVGPFLFTLRGGVLHALDNSRSLRLEARALEKVVALGGGKTRKLLDDVNLVVQPGEFVTLLGPSGSGKSTLMDCLNGRRRATGGQVLANGEDFYRHFDSFRQSLGYVPQKDIVHTGLTVYRALYYTAQLRLPADTESAELQARIAAVLKEMELVPHRDTLVANLSGGQIKRVSLGAELIGQPCMLYIDEATSGLDAGTEARMMRLFRNLADQGRSIVCITHNVDNIDQCHLALVLARGRLVYYGPPGEAPHYFGVKRISDIYDRLSERDPADWEKQYRHSPLCDEFIVRRLAAPDAAAPPAAAPAAPAGAPDPARPAQVSGPIKVLPEAGRPPARQPLAHRFRELTSRYLQVHELVAPLADLWRQFRVLTARYVELLLGDRRGLRLLMLQAPVVGLFLFAGFYSRNYNAQITIPRQITDEERATFALLNQLDQRTGDGDLSAQAVDALKKLQYTALVRTGPGPDDVLVKSFDGDLVARLLNPRLGKALSDEQRTMLEQASFVVKKDGTPLSEEEIAKLKDSHDVVVVAGGLTLTGRQLLDSFKHLREAHLPAKILEGGYLPDHQQADPRYTYMITFIVAIIVIWFGCNNAAKEIVKEEAIYSRERAVNLGITPYLASKFLVLSVMTIFHVALLMGVLFGLMEVIQVLHPEFLFKDSGWLAVPNELYRQDYFLQFGILSLLAMAGVALGLLLSACVATPDRANALMPYVLIPQIILGGGLLTVKFEGGHGLLYWLAAPLSPVFWAYRALHRGAHALPPDSSAYIDYEDAIGLPCLMMGLQILLLLLLTAWFLRRKAA